MKLKKNYKYLNNNKHIILHLILKRRDTLRRWLFHTFFGLTIYSIYIYIYGMVRNFIPLPNNAIEKIRFFCFVCM
jgi:hypothetical protein